MKKGILVGFGLLFVIGIILGGCGDSEEAAVEEPAVEAETAVQEAAPAQEEAAPVMKEAAAVGDQGTAKLDQTPMFNEIDADKDGKVTSEEWTAAGAPDRMFQRSDADEDGSVTLEELNASSRPPDVDKNQDGKATLSELKEFVASRPARGGAPEGGYTANSPHVGEGVTGQAFIDLLDEDKDGKVNHDEWERWKIYTVYKDKHWPEYNQNNDDYITLDEAPQEGVNWEPAPEE